MSVTVKDILGLPTMRGAEVVAGKAGLDKIVTGVTVLEFSTPGKQMEELFETNSQYMGNELCIAGFLNCPEDVEAQCYMIRHTADVGMVCMVLYYVGVFMPKIDERMRKAADEQSFPLICMPRNRMDLRYADLIAEVMELVIRDRGDDSHLGTEVISQILHLPEHQRTVDTALRIVSRRLQVNVVLTSTTCRLLGESVWPRSSFSIAEHISPENVPETPGQIEDFAPLAGFKICMLPVSIGEGGDMRLFFVSEGEKLRIQAMRAAAEAVRLTAEIWSSHHSEPVRSELVRAILQDEPIKMRQLAQVLGIDITGMHTFWILRLNDPQASFERNAAAQVTELMREAAVDVLADLYLPSELAFVFCNKLSAGESDRQAGYLLSGLEEAYEGGLSLTMYQYLETTTDVRESYLKWKDAIPDARCIQPKKKLFRGQDIDFARRCKNIVLAGEQGIAAYLSALEPLKEEQLLQTLEVFLLDAGSSMALCAEELFVHKNTVKYRLHRIADILGFEIGEMPATANLYIAAAIRRILRQQEK